MANLSTVSPQEVNFTAVSSSSAMPDTGSSANVGYLLWKILSPVILVPGTIGNILSIIVNRRKRMRKLPVSLFLAVVAVSDLMVLYSSLLRWWVYYLTDEELDFGSTSPFLCPAMKFFAYVGIHLSAWMLVVMAIQRFVSVRFPVRASRTCTVKSSAIVALIVTVLCCILNLHFLCFSWSTKDLYIYSGDKYEYFGCTQGSAEYSYFLIIIWSRVDYAMSTALPFFLLIVSNAFLIHKLIPQQAKKKTVVNGDSSTNDRNEHKRKIMTKMLVTNSLAFLALTTPVYIWAIGRPYWYDGTEVMDIVEAIVYMVWYINYGINFFLYCASSPPFRKEAAEMFERCCCFQAKVHPSKEDASITLE